MKILKRTDFYAQVAMIIFFVCLALANNKYFFHGYFIVGGWQVLSTVLHRFTQGRFYPARDRKYYNWTLVGLLGACILFIPVFMIFGFVLLIISPFLAIWYATICYSEIQNMERKEFVHLK